MHFDSLSSLWLGLSLPAIVLLYLFKRKYIDTDVSSHMLWNRVLKDMEANRPWQKLRNRLLMFVQLLVAALLVLAVMQPWVWSHRAAKAHVVVVLDRSASMTAAASASPDGNGETALDLAKRQIADWAAGDGKNSAITLLAMGEQAEVLLSKETDAGKLREALEKVEPSYGKTAYKEAMSLASALTRSDPDSEIRLFTDGQIAEPMTGLTFAVPVAVHRIGETEGSGALGNVGIVQFGVKSERSSSGGAAAVTAVAAVKNWGEAPRRIEAALYAGDELADVQTVTVEPGKQVSLYFAKASLADWYRLDIGADDSLAADNVSYAFPEGDRPRNVLLVGGGNLFLEKAMQLAGAEVTKLDPDGMEAWIRSQKPGSGPDLVVVDSVPDGALASEEWSRMLATRPVWYIRSGYAGEEKTVPVGAYTVEDHPATRYLKFQDTHVASARPPAGLTWGKPIVTAKNVPLVYAGAENGQPRLLLAFALSQSDLPLRSEFPVFVQNALAWLTSAHGGSLGRAVAGERRDVAMSAGAASATWVAAEDGRTAGEAETSSGRLASVQTMPAKPGLYRLEEKDEAGQTVRSRWLGVVADPRESAEAEANIDMMQNADRSAEAGRGETPSGSGQSGDESGAPYALWRLFAALALAAVVWEWGVYRRGSAV
ncbi:vWA domain-containing protein [Paenibacillus sp. GYB003]|uniref:vWA domain-containing protein n=1 Tax=Paenibacillus sp. GYB003 TaxID=2994392 RepID=UPI002F964477